MRTICCVLSLAAVLVSPLIGSNAPASAQGVQTGSIAGQVLDQSDAVLPGATVTATSRTLQGERSTVIDSTGRYLIRALPAGLYTVRLGRRSKERHGTPNSNSQLPK
jgi:hypothetical protein